MANSRKLASEIEAKKQVEEKARKESEAAEKKAQNATDVEKIRNLISDIKSIYIPNVKNEKASEIVNNIELLLSKVVNFGNNEINKI